MTEPAKKNKLGRRIGEDHPRAVLLDHEVDLILDMLAERDDLVAELGDSDRRVIDAAITAAGLSYRCIAAKFEVHKSCIAKIATGSRRCQRGEG